MAKNLTFFTDNHGVVNIHQHTPQESKSEPLNARFESWRLQQLKAFCFDNGLSLSEAVRDATDFYRMVHPAVHQARKTGKLDALLN